ncbi:AFG3-like protein 1 [Terrapene carolina triunguis]|uniref:AFG3-like protein 1 n=1 Tax=Terrapene triunguis TaxID=2587831 RepID=UPI001156BD4E|nr:AFG3-like protein 1 [Terrapene carolina triunguis]
MAHRLASGTLVPPLAALWRGGCRTHTPAGLRDLAPIRQWLKGIRTPQQGYPGSIASAWQWLCSKPPKGFEKYFKKNGKSPGPAEDAHLTKGLPDPKDLGHGGNGGGGGGKRGGKKEDSGWWRRVWKGEFPWDDKNFCYLVVMGAGAAVGFLYFFWQDPGREINWKHFVHYYLARGLVRKCRLCLCVREWLSPGSLCTFSPFVHL